MTKLMQWLFCLVIFLGVWLSLVFRKNSNSVLKEYSSFIIFLPAILTFLFCVYAGSVILWRVFTFNDCKEAALELRKQIDEAKSDLKEKGFQFRSMKT